MRKKREIMRLPLFLFLLKTSLQFSLPEGPPSFGDTPGRMAAYQCSQKLFGIFFRYIGRCLVFKILCQSLNFIRHGFQSLAVYRIAGQHSA